MGAGPAGHRERQARGASRPWRLTPRTADSQCQWWSCCLSASSEAPGCTVGKHQADEQLERHLRKLGRRDAASFPVEAFGFASRAEPAAGGVEACPSAEEVPAPASGHLTHRVLPTDTLVGIALHYGTTPAEVLKLNKLPSGAALHAKATVLVPYAAGQAPPAGHAAAVELAERALALRKFREAARKLGEKVSVEEARLYLADTTDGSDWEAAFAELQADVAWEREEGGKRAHALRREVGRAGVAHSPGVCLPQSSLPPGAEVLSELHVPLLHITD